MSDTIIDAIDWKLPWDGHCRCGQTRIRASAPPLVTMACHCTGCQRMTASAFSLSVAIPTDGFAIVAGTPILGGLKGDPHHYFCPSCMSWMFTKLPQVPYFVNVRATMFEHLEWFRPFVETWAGEKLPWASTPAEHSFATLPPDDAWPGLIAEYAQRMQSPPPASPRPSR